MNPFRDKTMRREYDAAVRAFRSTHESLFRPDGSPKTLSSSFAEHFWRGYNGARMRVPNNTVAYAYWRAGKDMKEASQ